MPSFVRIKLTEEWFTLTLFSCFWAAQCWLFNVSMPSKCRVLVPAPLPYPAWCFHRTGEYFSKNVSFHYIYSEGRLSRVSPIIGKKMPTKINDQDMIWTILKIRNLWIFIHVTVWCCLSKRDKFLAQWLWFCFECIINGCFVVFLLKIWSLCHLQWL